MFYQPKAAMIKLTIVNSVELIILYYTLLYTYTFNYIYIYLYIGMLNLFHKWSSLCKNKGNIIINDV